MACRKQQPHLNRLISCTLQVGIVALNLIGEPLQPAPEGPPPYLDVDGPVSHELQYYNRAAAEVADLQLDVHVDSSTAARIKVMHQRRACFEGLLCASSAALAVMQCN
jgi:centrosomal protein CEP104